MRRVAALLLRLPACAVLACALVAGVPGAWAGEEPPALAPPDPCASLWERLASLDGKERAGAEAELARADGPLLRRLVEHLRRLAPAPAAATAPARVQPEDIDPALGEAPLVDMQVRLVEAGAAQAAVLLALGRPAADGSLHFDEAALSVALAAAEKGSGLTLVSAPRLSAFVNQDAEISILDQTSYVSDYEVHRMGDGVALADPIVQTIQSGVRLGLKAHPLGADIYVEARVDLAELIKPIASVTTRLAPEGLEVALQLPEVVTTRSERRVIAPPGVPVLLAALTTPTKTDGERVLIFLTAALVTQPKDR